MHIQIDSSILELFLPEGALEWFDLIKGERDKEAVRITLEEKNMPPVPPQHKDKRIWSKGFFDITITDFPIRGRRGVFTFRRRRWQIEGEKEILKRDIKITFPGTQLEKEFAVFLKGDSRQRARVANFSCEYPKDTRQGI
ncbi:MAG: hypothetical protein A3D92_20370 [Bacteroidetes bacterium RIFCSPHIGHO2_02_FULL_44_7]|nr:MAG: hypothetical protein A3D92_20370 [Bacteroidetes bacterium RIFCSPHIGHO2_02_FULL_44_7]